MRKVAVVVDFLRDLHIVRAVVELFEDSSVVEVIFVGAGGRQWSWS
jgi:type IV secretory pathway VirB2 component (pilin)